MTRAARECGPGPAGGADSRAGAWPHRRAYTPVSETQRGRPVITGVEGEFHQIGANMVADVLESGGWDVRFLVTQLPHAGILDAVEEHDADLLGISVTMVCNLPHPRSDNAGIPLI